MNFNVIDHKVNDAKPQWGPMLPRVKCVAIGRSDSTQTRQLGKLRDRPRTQTASGAAQDGDSELRAVILNPEASGKVLT